MIPVAITAAPRDPAIHQRSFASVHAAGFRDVAVMAEPGTELPAWVRSQWIVRENTHRCGQWHNFIQSLEWHLLHRCGDRFCTIEDDVIFCCNVEQLLSTEPWPEERCGCVQVYAPAAYAHHPAGCRSVLPPEEALDMLGACALLFSRAAVECLVDWARTKGWRGDAYGSVDDPQRKKDGDTYVGEVLTVEGFTIWTRNPSLAQHIGIESTLQHQGVSPRRSGLRWPGEDADAWRLFGEDEEVVTC